MRIAINYDSSIVVVVCTLASNGNWYDADVNRRYHHSFRQNRLVAHVSERPTIWPLALSLIPDDDGSGGLSSWRTFSLLLYRAASVKAACLPPSLHPSLFFSSIDNTVRFSSPAQTTTTLHRIARSTHCVSGQQRQSTGKVILSLSRRHRIRRLRNQETKTTTKKINNNKRRRWSKDKHKGN